MRDNNFDILRHLLALSVVWHHFNVLTSNSKNFILFDVINSNVAVKSFFVISGLLIWTSANRSMSALSYTQKRFFRLYPALIFILCSSSLIALLLFGQKGIEVFSYIAWNGIFLNFMYPCIGNVFESNTMCAVNGALWTLKLEVAYYIFIGVIVFKFRNVAFKLVVVFTIVSFFLDSVLMFIPEITQQFGSSISQQIPFKFYYFGLGVILMRFENSISTNNLLVAIISGFLGWYVFNLEFIFLPVFVVSFVFLVAFRVKPVKFSRHGDFSYGLYIYHFPLIQIFVYMNWLSGNYLVDLFMMLLILVTLCKFSWEFIEKPSLNYCHKLNVRT